ncbi:MAG TPA: FAD-binding oxidoreductase [Solirubrobacterales bacterium]|jgi:alkyldihydroxyacetonephosphate synthase|nr:FAD-binding oxidoreductase [Solirubrobacterales bacterium]
MRNKVDMSTPRRDSKWWGWGDPSIEPELDAEARAMLEERIGPLPAVRTYFFPHTGKKYDLNGALAEFQIPDAEPLPRALVEAVGEDAVFDSTEDRLRHATGCGYADLVRLRGGRLEAAPDAVLLPADADSVRRVLEVCAAEGVAVVPYGGGTSVVGGVEPLRGSHSRLVALDLSRLRGVEVDPRSLTARLGAGLRGPEAETALNAGGVVLGHYPQSFEYATIGGFAATRSAGQASSGYGCFDELVAALRLIAPTGELRTLETPHTAAGPSLRELALGSEGVFGVIPEVTVRVRPAPSVRRYEAWMVESFAAGAEIVRSLAQGPGLPDVIRVSDEEETEVSLALSGPRGLSGALFDGYLGLRRRRGGCLVVVGFEGDEESVARRRALAVRELRRGGGAYLGQSAGRSWEHGRYQGPYLRDTLMDMGTLAETLETSHTWSRLQELHAAVAAAIRDSLAGQGTPGLAFSHISHAYADGASLYFTFIARAREGAELEQWATVKRAASEAIVAHGGTITHHHAVGRDHLPYMQAEVGETGVEMLRAVKERLDPAGIMNPGKLIPS